MPGPILTASSSVQCAHVGKATPVTPIPRVLVDKKPVVVQITQYAVAGCQFPSMTSGAPPCVTAQFTSASTKVKVLGNAVLLGDSRGTSAPNGTPLLVVPEQFKVIAK